MGWNEKRNFVKIDNFCTLKHNTFHNLKVLHLNKFDKSNICDIIISRYVVQGI
jgi:hypothetical protein